jgi:hypothetical protein
MLRNWKLVTLVAIAISACGTVGSVYAGGHGGHSGGSRSGGFSGGFSGGSSRMSGGFKPSSGGSFKPSGGSNSGVSGVIRSGNFGGINLGGSKSNSGGIKTLPKNTGVVGPVVPRVGNSNSGVSGIIKNINGSSSGNVVKKGNSNNSQISKSVLGGLGINLGGKFPSGGSGNGNGPGSGNGNGPGKGNGNGSGNGNSHHHHHHCWPPIVFSLPVCQPNYCPPPCPPIYYPQPYPVADPVPVPVGDPAVVVNNNVTVTGDSKPAEPTTDKPVDTTQPADLLTSSDAKPEAKPEDVAAKDAVLPKIPVGATLTLQGKDLADKQGQVVLQLGDIALPATINEWKNDSVTCTLPVLGLTKASKATLHVVKADGKTASTMNCELVTTLPTSVDVAPASTTEVDLRYEQ